MKFIMWCFVFSMLTTINGNKCTDTYTCNTKFSDLNHSITTLLCPANCWRQKSTLCGNGVYSDGPICLAAMQDQLIDDGGGPVAVYKSEGNADNRYIGGSRNGVISNSCRKAGSSYSFEMSCSVKGDSATDITQVFCPSGCGKEPVYGTGIYSIKSSVCSAAIHAGKLTENGGFVKIFVAPGQANYLGATKNGAASLASGHSNSSFSFSTCPRSHFDFNGQNGNYVRYTKPFPSLGAATLCAWITLRDTSRVQGFFSYLTNNNGNEFLLEFNNRLNPKSLVLIAKGRLEHFPVDFETDNTHHVCAWFDLNKIGVSVDGMELGRLTSSGPALKRSGSFVLGTDEHPTRGQYFQYMNGAIGNFVLYDRLLSSTEISAMAAECRCPYDYVISMTSDEAEVVGVTGTQIPSKCPKSM